MASNSSGPNTRLVLVAAFGSLRDAEVAARFLTDRGVPTTAIPVSKPDPEPVGLPKLGRDLGRPLIYAAFGGVLFGMVGTVLWSALFPALLTPTWRIAITVLCGASAAGSIGRLVDYGLDPGSCRLRSQPAPEAAGAGHRDRAVVAVRAGQVNSAARLLRRIGADGLLVRDPLP